MVMRRHFIRHAVNHHIGQHRAVFRVKSFPDLILAKHFRGADAGQFLTGMIPDQHPPPGINDKGRNGAVAHQAFGKLLLIGQRGGNLLAFRNVLDNGDIG